MGQRLVLPRFAFRSPVRAIAWLAALGILCLGLVAAKVHAMRVSPMVIELELSGGRAVGRIEVQNLNKGKLTFETRVTRLNFDSDGTPVETPADEDFLVFPPQGGLPENARQAIRLQWVGPTDIKSSQAYYVAVRQLPVVLTPEELAKAPAQIQVVYHMKALVVVSPRNAKPNVSAAAAKAIMIQPPAEKKGGALPQPVPGVEVTLQNSGNRHAMMAGIKWQLEGKDKAGKPLRIVLTQDDLNKTVGTGYIAALGGKRTFRIPLTVEFGPAPISVKFIQ